MNLGFFVQTNAGTPQNTKIYNFLNEAIDKEELDNATVFFNDTGFNPIQTKFGMFNSADLWYYKGSLVCTSVENLLKAMSVVNDIKLAYFFSAGEDRERHIFDFIKISRRFPVITDNIVDQHTFYRLTGKKPALLEDWSVTKLGEILNG